MSVHLGSVGGTTIEIDPTFFILVAFFVITSIEGPDSVLTALLWAPILFVSILLHEFGHATMNGLLGFGSSRIVLGGMGGLTYNSRHAKPWQDVLVSAAGPAVSFAIWLAAGWMDVHIAYIHTDRFLNAFVPSLAWANLVWGIFNLLPVGTLDGGHVMANILKILLPPRPAFVIAVWISMIVGTCVGIYGIFGRQFILTLLMGMFVYNSYIQWTFYRSFRRPPDPQ